MKRIKFILRSILVLFFLAGCGWDEENRPLLICDSNARYTIGDYNTTCANASIEHSFNQKADIENATIKFETDEFGEVVIKLNPTKPLQKWAQYTLAPAEVVFSSPKIKQMNSGNISVHEVDRDNELLSFSFQFKALLHDVDTVFGIRGSVRDLPITEGTN